MTKSLTPSTPRAGLRALLSKAKERLNRMAWRSKQLQLTAPLALQPLSTTQADEEAEGDDERTPLVKQTTEIAYASSVASSEKLAASSTATHSASSFDVLATRPIIPVLIVRACGLRRVELLCEDNARLLKESVLQELKCRVAKGAVRIHERDAYVAGRAIAEHLGGVKQLWFESCGAVGSIIRGILDVHIELAEEGIKKERFYIEQLTALSLKRAGDLDYFTRLVRLARKSLVSISLRRVHIPSKSAVVFLWAAIGACSSLVSLQYEPYKLDGWSRPEIVAALDGKQINSLVLTGVEGLSAADLVAVASATWMSDLSVVGELIRPSALLEPAMKRTLSGLNNLLLQMDTWFSLGDTKERDSLLELLASMKDEATLEVVQPCGGGASEAARLLSYWLLLAHDANRTIKLKLEEISQEKLDCAVGRLLRKVSEARKLSSGPHTLNLTMGDGKVMILDEYSWFGEEFDTQC